MAKEEKKEENKKTEESKDNQQPKSTKASMIIYTIIGVTVIAASAGGFALAQLLASSPQQEQLNPEDQMPEHGKSFEDIYDAGEVTGQTWQYPLDPVVANLDEPGVTRYVRATVILVLSSKLDQAKAETYLETKNLLMIDWLNTYLAGLSLERVRGTDNQTRIKREIREHFNDLIFPSTEPYIEKVLFKEFAVQ
jgi:flagellar basal body-associated protein FliL